MQQTFKRFLSTLLVLVMVLTMVSVLGHTTASATTEDTAAESTNTTEPDYKVDWDFEEGDTQGTSSGLTKFERVEKGGNHVLHVGSDGSSNAYWVIDNSVIGSQSKITITYNIAIGDTSKITYFPAPIPNGTNAPQYTGQFFKVRNWVAGELEYEVTEGTTTTRHSVLVDEAKISTKANRWYTVKMVYEPSTGEGYVEIDGNKTNVTKGNSTTRKVYMISMRFHSGYANDAYLDNVRVTVGDVDHEPAVPTACLCANGPTYTDGKCTGCGAYKQLKFSNAALVLQDNLAINFKADASLFEDGGYRDPYAVFTFNNKSYTVEDYTTDKDGQYVFQFSDIAPHMMGDKITYTLYASSGNEPVTGASGTYSVLDYCTGKLEENVSNELNTLLVDTLNYGAAAQTYMKYNTEELVNADLTDVQNAMATPDLTLTRIQELQSGEENLYAQWKSARLLLDDAITVRLTFTAASKDGLTVKIEGVEQKIVDSGTEGTYYVYYSLTPKQLSDKITAEVFNGDDLVSKTLSFSAEHYAAVNQDSSEENLPELVMAMMKYGKAAEAFAKTQTNAV